MKPPVYEIASANAGVQAQLGASPTRIFGFGEAKQGVAKPYAVWQTVIGLPENYLQQAPDIDQHSVQIDVYAATEASAYAAATALRNAYEPTNYVTSFRLWPRDVETNNYRVTLEVDFWQDR